MNQQTKDLSRLLIIRFPLGCLQWKGAKEMSYISFSDSQVSRKIPWEVSYVIAPTEKILFIHYGHLLHCKCQKLFVFKVPEICSQFGNNEFATVNESAKFGTANCCCL